MSRGVGVGQRVEKAFDEVAGTRRRVNGRESRGFDVISCLRCVVAGVRYIEPNDRPRRAAVRDLSSQIPPLSTFLFRFRDSFSTFSEQCRRLRGFSSLFAMVGFVRPLSIEATAKNSLTSLAVGSMFFA